MTAAIPRHGRSADEVAEELGSLRAGDSDQTIDNWKSHCFLYTFHASDEVYQCARDAYMAYLSTDALSDLAFPSVARLRQDLTNYSAELLRAPPQAGGTLTTGGTESIILAMTAARNRARQELGIAEPEVILADTAHPAFSKAAGLLDMTVKRVPVTAGFQLDLERTSEAINASTCMLVGSAPTYWHGVHDDIAALSELALEHDLWLHVDGCMGGLIGSLARLAAYPVPDFDFSLPGVRSISMDFHKYGFSMKGASILMMREASDVGFHTFVTGGYADYATSGLPGTKSGAAIASAWAVFNRIGLQGFIDIARASMRAKQALIDGLEEIDGLEVNGEPALTLLTISAPQADIFSVAAGLEQRGWVPNAFHQPDCLHLRLTPAHEPVIPEFLADLKASLADARQGTLAPERTGAYGSS